MSCTHDLVVHGFHCDLYGHVNNARYLEFPEAARWEALKGTIDVEQWHERGWLFVVAHIEISYRAAATLGDALCVHTWQGEFGGRSARVLQRVIGPGGRTVVDATITYVILDRATQKPLRMEGEVRAGLESLPSEPPQDASASGEDRP